MFMRKVNTTDSAETSSPPDRQNRQLHNRSVPAVTVIPVLGYPDVDAAVAWLCDCFGFTERLRIGHHRVQ